MKDKHLAPAEQSLPQERILIMGIGNTLLCDEGFGVHALYYLQRHYDWPDNVTLVDGATRGLMLMAELMDCDLAIILDIVLGGGEPGTTYLLGDDELGKALSFRQSMHQTSLEDILVSCDLAGHRPRTLVFGFEPFDYRSASELPSPQAARLLPGFCRKVTRELAKMNIVAAREKEENN